MSKQREKIDQNQPHQDKESGTVATAAGIAALGAGAVLMATGCGGGGGGGDDSSPVGTTSPPPGGTTSGGTSGSTGIGIPASFTVIDPVTRIEGHLKVAVEIDTVNGVQQVTDARCTGTLFRGFEQILAGRDPRDAPYLTERICGVCPVSHGLAATMALEDAAAVAVPANARILRNLVLGANFLQSHILHFYLLAALDYVNAPPGAPWSPAWNIDLMRSGNLQRISSNLPAAITMRRKAHEMGAIFGGKMPHPSAFQAGGMTAKPTSSTIGAFTNYLDELAQFIDRVYIPDVQLLQSVYDEYSDIGKGHGHLMAYGVFDLDDRANPNRLLRRGVVNDSAPNSVQTLSTSNIREQVSFSWYANSTDDRHPAGGSTVAVDPSAKPDAYSWLKAPRYDGKPMECGPLARMWVNGDYWAGVSVMDRHMARALEAQKIADAMFDWLDQLVVGNPVYNSYSSGFSQTGEGLTEAPRGALGHWVSTAASSTRSPTGGPAIGHYQIITPTCWNASPMDGNSMRGPIEEALVGTPVQDASQPVEVLRVIHSFDPCMSCAVHVMRPDGKPEVVAHAGVRG
ncbi:MAG: nickel-dependent hydrogenase large subunit [Syntrophotaleaceae bacterium]